MNFHLYDTTLRDGSQQEGLTLSVDDKLTVARLLDELGITHIEGGWPGAIPRDTEFFRRARTELTLHHATLAAFGATRRPGTHAKDDPQVAALVASEAPVITLVAKSDARHVEAALRTTEEENLAMVRDTVEYLCGEGREVFVDAEHFFDGWANNPEYTARVVTEAFTTGASVVILCDTNGGHLPHEIGDAVRGLTSVLASRGITGARLGAHMHNDSGCAIANTLEAVRAGAIHVQGCINGYGERTGNADLIPVIANLQLKLGMNLVSAEQLAESTRVSHAIGEIANLQAPARAPYVGVSAFAHKAGLHASAIRVDPDLYQHTDPRRVGNDMRMIVSDMAGRASIELKGRELGIELSGHEDVLSKVAATVKGREAEGYSYEAADASFEMLLRHELEELPVFFEAESWKASAHMLRDGTLESEATVRLRIPDGTRRVTIAEGNGPVNALDRALIDALEQAYPQVSDVELEDFKVRILDSQVGTGATTRVLISLRMGAMRFTTVGVGPNLLEAAWEALFDAYWYGLYKTGVTPRRG